MSLLEGPTWSPDGARIAAGYHWYNDWDDGGYIRMIDGMFGLAGEDALNSRDNVNGNDTVSGGEGTDTKVTDATEARIVGFP